MASNVQPAATYRPIPIAPVVRLAGQYDLVDFVSREPSLEEVFLSEYGTTSDAAPIGATR